MDDRDFQRFGELEKLSDDELEAEVIKGVNLHIHTSKASVAKRILENRRQKKQVEAASNVEQVAEQIKSSNHELLSIVGSLNEIVKILNFIEDHWLPKQPLWIKIVTFILGTVLLGIILNIIASGITKFWLHW